MKRFFLYGILSVSTLLSFCNQERGYLDVGFIEDLQKLFHLGFADINGYDLYLNGKLLNIRDSLFVGDDDTEWHGKCFFHNEQLIFIAENNWVEKDSVSIIQISDSRLKTKQGIGVHSFFSKAKSEINFDSWKSFPDGYIMFKDKYNPKLVYDFGANEPLGNMGLDISTFPEESIIKAILLNR